MKQITRRTWALIVMAFLGTVLLGASSEGAVIYFEDNFDGRAIDATKWNTDIATSGMRFCPTDVVNHHTYGTWQDVSLTPCSGTTQAAPYGSVSVQNGVASFSSGYSRTFPYIWAGPPSRKSLFPETGDFTLEVGMQYSSLPGNGAGIQLLYSNNSDPGSNPPLPPGSSVYGIWGDARGLFGGGPVIPPYLAAATAYHTYRLEYINGSYSAYRDGVLVSGPTANTKRPNTLWIGNAVYTSWGFGDWSDFSVDFIRVTVPNGSPVAEAGCNKRVEMTSCDGAAVTLDGSGSSDPDGDQLTYTWSWTGGSASGVRPTVTLPYGETTLSLTVDDGKGGTATDTVVVNVVDTTPPGVVVAASPNLLWPPNHKYIDIAPATTVTDACINAVTVQRLSVSSNEPDNGLGDGDIGNDIAISADGRISLRAERSGTGSGRVYIITYQATDIGGNTAIAETSVTVPHNR